jgi:hypothetical protein
MPHKSEPVGWVERGAQRARNPSLFSKQASGRFFKKKLRKKLLLPGDVATSRVKTNKSFWGAFFQKGAFLLAFFELA